MLKRVILDLVGHAGWEVYKDASGSYVLRPKLRLSTDAFTDARRIFGDIRTVFDVGANVGQTALRLAAQFPAARIYSFEPDPESFAKLDAATRQLNVSCVPSAVGSGEGSATFHRYRFGETNSLLPKAPDAEKYVADSNFFDDAGTATVQVTSIDAFCGQNEIPRIDLLKIDTQGYELEVLKGASRMLAAPVPLVYTEVTFVRYYVEQPLFPDIYGFLYERGYRFVGLYESGFLTHHYQVGGNALFVHEQFGERRVNRTRKLGPVVLSH